MSAATKSSVSVGKHVVIVPVDGPANPSIFEVVDCRLGTGGYSFTIAPVTATGLDFARGIPGMPGSSLRVVGEA